MTDGEASPQQRVDELREQIAHHNERYHTLDDPEVSDAEFDALARELRALEFDHPDLIVPNSPSAQIGGLIGTAFSPVEHRVPMLAPIHICSCPARG